MRSRGVYIHETCLIGILDSGEKVAGGGLACERCRQHADRARAALAEIMARIYGPAYREPTGFRFS